MSNNVEYFRYGEEVMPMKSPSSRIIWQPQPRQIEFLRRPEYEVLYGGAAGGG